MMLVEALRPFVLGIYNHCEHSHPCPRGALQGIRQQNASETKPLLSEKPGAYEYPNFSPDGKRVAPGVSEGGSTDIWVYDTQRDTMTRLTFGEVRSSDPPGARTANTSFSRPPAKASSRFARMAPAGRKR
jgi:hypothetical protein